jgi:transcriptional regulator with XRE-family HTH domain
LEDLMEDFSTLLERFRIHAGLSQSELARAANISASYINRVEKGERQPPSRAVVLRIAEVLGLDSAATDTFLLAGGYAPERPALLPREHPILGLIADILQDDRVPEEEIELLKRQIELIERRWRQSDQEADADGQKAP